MNIRTEKILSEVTPYVVLGNTVPENATHVKVLWSAENATYGPIFGTYIMYWDGYRAVDIRAALDREVFYGCPCYGCLFERILVNHILSCAIWEKESEQEQLPFWLVLDNLSEYFLAIAQYREIAGYNHAKTPLNLFRLLVDDIESFGRRENVPPATYIDFNPIAHTAEVEQHTIFQVDNASGEYDEPVAWTGQRHRRFGFPICSADEIHFVPAIQVWENIQRITEGLSPLPMFVLVDP